jgi:hypothetical protein
MAPLPQVVPQHCCPGPPQAVHMPPEQVKPVLHADPAQQTCLSPPHATHIPLLPHKLPPAHIDPAQQS